LADFRGNASIANGLFEFSFVVPRDIRIPLADGRISFYAKNQTTLKKLALTQVSKLAELIKCRGGQYSPTVKLYMNDETFISGGITNASPFLLASRR
jgi:hypothetical protein